MGKHFLWRSEEFHTETNLGTDNMASSSNNVRKITLKSVPCIVSEMGGKTKYVKNSEL